MFFVLLGIAFAVAVWLRIRSLEARAEVVQTASAATDATALEDGTIAAAPQSASETYTLEPVSGATTASSGTRTETPAQRTSREQRYEELLRSAPPPGPAPSTAQAATAKPAEPPTLFDRVVNPIASALGINRNKPPQAPMNPPQRHPSTANA